MNKIQLQKSITKIVQTNQFLALEPCPKCNYIQLIIYSTMFAIHKVVTISFQENNPTYTSLWILGHAHVIHFSLYEIYGVANVILWMVPNLTSENPTSYYVTIP